MRHYLDSSGVACSTGTVVDITCETVTEVGAVDCPACLAALSSRQGRVMAPVWKDATAYLRTGQLPQVYHWELPEGLVAVHRNKDHPGRWFVTARLRGVILVSTHMLRSTSDVAARDEAITHVRQVVRALYTTVQGWDLGSDAG